MSRIATAVHSFAMCVLVSSGLGACSKPAETPPAAPPPPSESARPVTIGGLDGLALRDGGVELPNDNQVFGVGHTPAEVAELLSAGGLATDRLSLSIQPLLVRTADRVLLFDTGAGPNMGAGAGKLGASMAEAGVDPASVTDIFISHLHGDHVGGLVDTQGALIFPSAAVHMSVPEWNLLQGLTSEAAAGFGISGHAALIAAIAPKISPFEPGSELLPGLVKAVEVKGHTPGHSAYLIGSGPAATLFIGDSMHHYLVSVQRPDWHIAFDTDAVVGAASRVSLLAQSAAAGQRIYAVHFPYPGVGKIERRADGYVWVPEQP